MIKFKLLLIKALIAIVASFLLVSGTVYAVNKHNNSGEEVKIIQQHDKVKDQSYIISKESVMSKLDSTVRIVSMSEDIHKSLARPDKSFFGERITELTLNGTYQMGIKTKDIQVLHIDNDRGIIHIKLGKPSLVSLDLPYNQLEFQKVKGWSRLSMNDEEQKNFYNASKKAIAKELTTNKEITKKANMYNEKAVKELFKDIPNVRAIVFE